MTEALDYYRAAFNRLMTRGEESIEQSERLAEQGRIEDAWCYLDQAKFLFEQAKIVNSEADRLVENAIWPKNIER